MDLTTATPVEIDTDWAPLAAVTNSHRSLKFSIQDAARNVADGWNVTYLDRSLARRVGELPEIDEKIEAAMAAEAPYLREWNKRGGWTRAYLVVTNGKGHVHRTTSCSTCYITTQFSWMIDFSGASEQEIVDAAGERACTVCYASAPVELRLDRTTTMFSEDEKRKAAEREERAAKRAKADVEKIVVQDYSDWSDKGHAHTFKTTRAATNAIAHELTSLTWYGMDHPSAARWVRNIEVIREALAAKGVDYDYDKALAAARKKAVRDGRDQAKY